MRLLELFEQAGKTAAVAFGRMNPPTIGHQKVVDAILKQKADAHFLFVSQTHKPTGKNKTRYENPLPFDIKLGFIEQAFPNIDIGDTSVGTAIGILQNLEKQGFENVVFVCGSDRVAAFTELFNKQNGIDYNLKSIKIESSGARDPDAEGAEGMSASKMRAAAIADDFDAFKTGLPAGLQGSADEVFSAVRQGLEPWLEQGVAEGVPQPGPSSGAPKQFGPDAKIQTRQMTVKDIISSIPGVPYYNNVVDDWDAKDYSWNTTEKVIEYATYLKDHPESLAKLPPIIVLNGKFEDGAHRVSAIWLLQQRMDPKNPLWKNAKLNVQFVKQGVAEASLGSVLQWPEVVNKVSSAMKATGWKGKRMSDDAFMFTTRGAEVEDQWYIAIIDNAGEGFFTYALGTVEEGDPHIDDAFKGRLPNTEASVSELMNEIRDGFGLD